MLLPDDALAGLPQGLRQELLVAYAEIVTNYRARRWEPSELNGGKLCEVVFTILRGWADGSYPGAAKKPSNMVSACRDLEKERHLPRSARIQIPRMLVALYEIRNNRNVGHVGGDVDPNHMDATCVLAQARWILAELVRSHHGLGADEAAQIIDAIVEREVPTIWDVGDRKRVLATGLSSRDETLLLLYGATGGASVSELLDWIEYGNASRYRKSVLPDLHKDRLVEFDATRDHVELSPRGIDEVETRLGEHLR